MNITSLNKIVSLIVSGVLTELVLVIWWFQSGGSTDHLPKPLGDFNQWIQNREFVTSLALGSLTVFIGLLTQACGEFMMHILKPRKWPRWVCGLFYAGKPRDDAGSHHDAAMKMVRKLEGHPLTALLEADSSSTHSAVLFHKGSEGSVRWGMEHYTMALLAANFIVITIFAAAAMFGSYGKTWTFWLLLIAILWLLVGTVVRKKLFAYEVAAREAALVLWDELKAKSLESTK